VYVLSSDHIVDEETGRNELPMDPCIELFRKLYADDMEKRCGLTTKEGVPCSKLPSLIAIAMLLNPLYGGRRRITNAGLMSNEQYDQAESDLISKLQTMKERECGHVEATVTSGTSDEDSLDDPRVRSMSSEQERAKDEFYSYCNLVKPMRHGPKSYTGPTLSLGSIQMGKVKEKGDDIKASLPFVNCNLADFIEDDGRFGLVDFLTLQKEVFPTLHKLAVCLSSIRTNEVGCERFFSTAGYVSCPRRTSLSVRNYECLATLKANMQHVFIDEHWVVNQYQIMEKKKSWQDLDTSDDMQVLKLERELLAASLGVSVDSLPRISDSDSEREVVDVDATVTLTT
jgi:hypothetical protein